MQIRKFSYGLTLIELIVVVTIIGLLSVIGFPAYKTYLVESRRNDAIVGLRSNQSIIENYIQQNGATPSSSNVTLASNSPAGFYTLAYTQVSASRYQLVATAVSNLSQNGDSGCTVLTLTSEMDDIYPTSCH